jgi:phosphoribosylanthranilate isomerase
MVVDAKICGLTRPEDAALAAEHGAWRLGVIFAGGPRQLDPARARAIVSAAGRIPVLGVFGPGPVRTILEVIAEAGLAGAQLHGDHPPETAASLRDAGVEVWQCWAVDLDAPLPADTPARLRCARTVLLEARLGGQSGGLGLPLPLALAREARQRLRGPRVVLAGGLTESTVAEAIRVVRPDAVDVSSGVESSPGIKDPVRLVRFLENVRHASTAP